MATAEKLLVRCTEVRQVRDWAMRRLALTEGGTFGAGVPKSEPGLRPQFEALSRTALAGAPAAAIYHRLPEQAAAAVGTATGDHASDVKLSLSADAKFAFILSLKFDLSLLEVQSGPVGAGGARWNLYRRGKRIDVMQSLAHTVVVPRSTASLKLVVATWIRESGFLGGAATQWTFAPRRFTVGLKG